MVVMVIAIRYAYINICGQNSPVDVEFFLMVVYWQNLGKWAYSKHFYLLPLILGY